jgi:hypothetical protein
MGGHTKNHILKNPIPFYRKSFLTFLLNFIIMLSKQITA